ncbi:hypothetical protein B0H13DRAFT_1900883 [Mycena leptocephala]|nr:hypothetical protein B0H13DRAFT_1900883 [Mycena leptocephala]
MPRCLTMFLLCMVFTCFGGMGAMWMKRPADIAIPDGMELQERNQANFDAQTANRASIRTTRSYETAVKDGSVTDTMDIGANLKPYYLYTTEEYEEMVTSTEFERLVGPIPPRLGEYIYRERKKREKEDAKTEDENMVMSDVVFVDAVSRPPVSAQDIFLAAIAYQQHPPIFWFTDERLRFATEHPGEIPTKRITPYNDAAAEKTWLIDVKSLTTTWGGDDSALGHSVHEWEQAFSNYLVALGRLSRPPDATNPFSYALEMEKHRNFFLKIDSFEKNFDIWYPVEKKLRNSILNRTAFDKAHWSLLRQ